MEREGRAPENALKSVVLAALGAMLLVGCGGGAESVDPGPRSDPNPPRVLSTYPIDGSSRISVYTPITITFSEAVKNVTPATIRLTQGSILVLGTVTDNGGIAGFTPREPLCAGTTYTATVIKDVTDLEGNSMMEDWTWTFTTRVGGWKPPVRISDGLDNTINPHVAMDDGGNAVAVWTQTDGTSWNIYANRYLPGTGWNTPTLLETGAGDAKDPQVAMNGSGDAVAAWVQHDGTAYSIWTSHYTPGTGWAAPILVEAGNGSAGSPQVAMNTSGICVVVWTQWDEASSRNRISANRFMPGTGWGVAEQIDAETSTLDAIYPQVAMDDNGNAVAVWSEGYLIYSNVLDLGSGWETTTTLLGYGFFPHVAMGHFGDAVAVWTYFNDRGWIPYMSVYCSRYVPGADWGWGTELDGGYGDPWNAHVAMNIGSYAVAVWEKWGSTNRNIWASHLNGTTPGAPTQIQDASENAFSPQVGIGKDGTAVCAWLQGEEYGVGKLYANLYGIPNPGWGIPILIGGTAGNAKNHRVAMGGEGISMVIWEEWDGARNNIWAVEHEDP